MRICRSNEMKRTFIWLSLAFLLYACGESQPSRCIPPPEGFTEKDLVGTWVAVNGWSKRNDTLIIREDGTYKQISYVESESFDYESDWQRWWLEYGNNGLPYLHMEGMRLCAIASGYIDCNVVGGGETAIWYDFCREDWTQMPGEGVLIVQGWPRGASETTRDVDLFLLRRGEDVWGYQRQEPAVPTATATSLP